MNSIPLVPAFLKELRLLGYIEGQNIVIERYSAEERAEYYPKLARKVAESQPDVIFAISNQLVLAFKQATDTIPIIAWVSDPVGSGIVPSLARPGGNITEVSANLDLSVWRLNC